MPALLVQQRQGFWSVVEDRGEREGAEEQEGCPARVVR